MRRLFITCILLASVFTVNAQFKPIQHPQNATQRQVWDSERIGMSFSEKEALDFANKVRLADANYYLASMYDGIYRSEIAVDVIGFQAAIPYLEAAAAALIRDYEYYLHERSSDYYQYFSYYGIQRDYCYIVKYLKEAYTYTNQPEKAYTLLRSVLAYNMQYYYVINPYQDMAWMVHRNRFYTSDQYAFLQENIADNEALALRLLDSSLAEAKQNVAINANFYSNYYTNIENSSDFTKSLLYSYQLNIDSATYYYDVGLENGYYSPNNLATYKVIQGKFAEGEMLYDIAEGLDDPADNALKEFVYYRSILGIYRNDLNYSIGDLHHFINEQKNQPGYGWYNLALARVWSYKGHTDSAAYYLQKAKNFKELHIGTTLGESHYDFSIRLLAYINEKRSIATIRTTDKWWWIKPLKVIQLLKKYINNYTNELLIVQQIANNPEKELVIFRLFSTESTVSWDELSQVLSLINPKKLVDYYQELLLEEPREGIKPYLQLMIANLYYEAGEKDKSLAYIKSLLQQNDFEDAYDQLFIGRINELYLKLIDDDLDQYYLMMNEVWEKYPQLLFYQTEVTPLVNLTIVGDEVKRAMRALNVKHNNHPLLPQFQISLAENELQLLDLKQNKVINTLTLSATVTTADIAYLLFRVNINE